MVRGPNHFSVNDGCHGTTAKRVAIERRIAAFRRRAVHIVGPVAFGVKERIGYLLILRYQDSPVQRVRYAATFALGCFPNDGRSIEGLLKLTSDPEDENRDWAVFGLGVMGNTDSPEIREALLRCLSDKDEDVREEAAVGLGKRRDRRMIPALLKMLEDPGLKVRVAEAAAAFLGMDKEPPEWTAADLRRGGENRGMSILSP